MDSKFLFLFRHIVHFNVTNHHIQSSIPDFQTTTYHRQFQCSISVGQESFERHLIKVLGKSKMILTLLEGLPTMLKGEVAMLKMKPELHYGEDDCPVSASDSFPKDAKLNFEIDLIDFSKVKIVTEDFGVLKKVVHEAQS
ncbi:hypothetical protein LXL04_002976 [Taraxacum kok-saghyz]